MMKNDQNPEWNESFVFYRRDAQIPIKITLWNHNLAVDTFIGQAFLTSHDLFEELSLPLKGRRGNKEKTVPGQIHVLIENFDSIEDF